MKHNKNKNMAKASNKPNKPQPIKTNVLVVNLTNPAPDVLHWDVLGLVAGDEVIWTFVEYGQLSGGLFVKTSGLPLYQAQWNPDIQDYNGGLASGYKIPTGTWAVRVSVYSGPVGSSTGWAESFSNILDGVVIS